MAYVKLSESLRNSIVSNLKEVFAKRKRQLTQNMRNLLNEQDILAVLIPPETQAKLDGIPKIFLQGIFGDLRIRFRTMEFHIPLQLTTHLPMDWTSPYAGSDARPLLPETYPHYAQLTDLYNEHKAVCKEEDETVTHVTDLLKKSVSVQQVMAIWPAVVHYLPAEATQKLHSQKPRNTTKRLAQTFGPLPDSVAVSLVRATLLKDTAA